MTTLWLIGTFEGTDAAAVPASAINAFPGGRFRRFRTLEAAAEWDGEPADVVLVVQHRPREFAPSDIAKLIASQPLAEFLVGLGAWCGSSARSEAAWPESIVVPVWDLQSSLHRIAKALDRGEVHAPWQTSSRDDVLLREVIARGTGCADGPVDLIVDSPDRVLAETLRDIAGGILIAQPANSRSPITLFDADPLPRRVTTLAELRRSRATDRFVVFVDQPTRSTVDRLKRAGADVVIAKPFRVPDLLIAIGSNGDAD